jgi:hypothetical protein
MQNNTAVSSLTVQLQMNDQLCIKHYNELVSYKRNISKSKRKCADKDLSYKGAKNVCLREDVYYNLLNNSSSVKVLQQRVKDLELELGEYITKTQETLTNGNVKRISVYDIIIN